MTGEIGSKVSEHGLGEGQVLIFVPGSTAGLTTVEFEPGLVRDLPEFFERGDLLTYVKANGPLPESACR